MNRLLKNKNKLFSLAVTVIAPIIMVFSFAAPVYASKDCGGGNGQPTIHTSIDLGCRTSGNPVMDLLFSIIRLLGAGVGIVVIASVILAGVQYSASRGDPQAAAGAMKRLSSSLIALLIYIFAYAILNFVIPGGFFV